ncbi:MAG: GTP pyrophosphokinase family protein [Clostridia bacterium]|nr:GTP pyrophosphokinase family protein [Clostridia bacterium]
MQMIAIDTSNKNFYELMNIYEQAKKQLEDVLFLIKYAAKQYYGYDIISNITSRIKTPQSIVNKMKKKNYDLTYVNLINNINDIAGIRIVCPMKSDIAIIKGIIHKIPNIEILKEKDYLKQAKKSGYSAYHMIIEVPLEYEEQTIYVKVELQIRTMAMDFWATNEHKIKYKTNSKISVLDSRKLEIYAKVLNKMDEEFSDIYKKQRLEMDKYI